MVRGRGKRRAESRAEEPPRDRVVAVLEIVARHLAIQPWARDLSTQEVADDLNVGPGDVAACLGWCEQRGLVTSSAHPESPGMLCWRATRQGFAHLVEVIESEQAKS